MPEAYRSSNYSLCLIKLQQFLHGLKQLGRI